MKRIILLAGIALFCTAAYAQNTKPQDLKPAATKERSAEEAERAAQKERAATKERQKSNNADNIASPGGRSVQRPGAGDPQVEAKRKAMEDERVKAEKERAMKQREEAMARGGNSARDRERVESAGQKVDRSKLEITTVEKEHAAAQKEAQAAIDRLVDRTADLRMRMVQMKNDVRAKQAAGASEKELAPDFDRIDRLGALLNAAEAELQFLMSVVKSNGEKVAPAQEEKK